MKILIISLGSRGDVQPYLALGVALKEKGHTVSFCTSVTFESFIRAYDLDYHYMNDGFIQLMNSQMGRKALEETTGLFGAAKTTFKLIGQVKPLIKQTLVDAWDAAQKTNPDIMIFGSKGTIAESVAEKLQIPSVIAMTVPQMVPTANSPAIGFPDSKLGRNYNLFTYKVTHHFMKLYHGMLNQYRKEILGLPKKLKSENLLSRKDGLPLLLLHCFSEHLFPQPEDWPSNAHVSGFWFLDRKKEWKPSAKLEQFLKDGDPPVYMGFGSMAGKNPKKLTHIAIEAFKKANVRGIIATGWGGMDVMQLPDNIIKIENAPHDWLFTKVAAVIHHGGAGTTAAGLKAGVPSIICPFFGDQPFWGNCIYKLGVGAKPIPQKKLTVDKLSHAIEEATQNQKMQEKAKLFSQKIISENGLDKAVQLIENLFTQD